MPMELTAVVYKLKNDNFQMKNRDNCLMIIKSLDPLSTKKTFIRKKLGHTAVSAIQASSVTL